MEVMTLDLHNSVVEDEDLSRMLPGVGGAFGFGHVRVNGDGSLTVWTLIRDPLAGTMSCRLEPLALVLGTVSIQYPEISYHYNATFSGTDSSTESTCSSHLHDMWTNSRSAVC